MSRTLVVAWAAGMLLTSPARAETSPQAAADALVEKARAALELHERASALWYVDSAIKRVPSDAEARFPRCSIDAAEADVALHGFVGRKSLTEVLNAAVDSSGRAAEFSHDAARRASIQRFRLRPLLMCEVWDDAAAVLEDLIAAALDRAGRAGDSRAAMEHAATRGPDFDRAARFELIWDRFDRKDDARLCAMIATLQRE